MSIGNLVNDTSADWQREPPASEATIQNLIAESGLELSSVYLKFLRHSNGGEGELSVSPGAFVIWSAEGAIEQNKEIVEYLSDFFAIGDDRGIGGMLAFDTRDPEPWKIFHF